MSSILYAAISGESSCGANRGSPSVTSSPEYWFR